MKRLLDAARSSGAAFRAACADVSDWDSLLDHAEQERVIGILAHCVMHVDSVPENVEARIRERHVAERLWQAHVLETLDVVVEVLGDHQVPTVQLKGPILSERLYADPLVRPSCDLDLLVHAADLPRTVESLESLGYRRGSDAEVGYDLRHHHHVSLYHPCRPPVEVHFRAFAGFGTVVPAEDLMARAVPYSSSRGTTYLVLSREDEALYLCLHAAGHAFSQLVWLHDIQTFCAQNPDTDWEAVFARARQCQVSVALAFALFVAKSGEWDEPARSLVREHLRHERATDALLRQLQGAPVDSFRAKALSAVLRLSLCENPILVWRQLRRHVAHGVVLPLYGFLPRHSPDNALLAVPGQDRFRHSVPVPLATARPVA
ncbi:MAG: nucleotidyltransferase family protein [Gemmataceae bacterium]|nr:nucleotidyltransferase family protein [Gemmataceae bacterium]